MTRIVSYEDKMRIVKYVKKYNLETADKMHKEFEYQPTFYTKYVKRFLDVFVSINVLLITIPLHMIMAIVTFFDVGSPIIFKQDRPGLNGKPFTIVKFRNMTNDKDDKGILLPVEKRVTKFGAFVRKTSLDEFLNFWSILKGDMSLIGPRPLAMAYLDRYSRYHNKRHSVKPGLECPNVSNNGYSNGWNEQFDNDVWYVQNVSFITDCKMVIGLFKMVFDKETRKKHAQVGVGDFLGYDENGKAFGANNVPEHIVELSKKEDLK